MVTDVACHWFCSCSVVCFMVILQCRSHFKPQQKFEICRVLCFRGCLLFLRQCRLMILFMKQGSNAVLLLNTIIAFPLIELYRSLLENKLPRTCEMFAHKLKNDERIFDLLINERVFGNSSLTQVNSANF